MTTFIKFLILFSLLPTLAFASNKQFCREFPTDNGIEVYSPKNPPPAGSAAWGSITGTLSSQTDLQTALNGKQATITTGTTLQYFRGDLSLATFPTNLSSFTNGPGYLTAVPANQTIADITYVIDGSGAAITTGIKGDLEIPFACTINRATLLADQSGSCVVNVWKQVYSSYPATVTQKITASAPPTISSAVKAQDSTLTGWTTAISAGDTLRFNVDSCSTIQRITLSLKCTKT